MERPYIIAFTSGGKTDDLVCLHLHCNTVTEEGEHEEDNEVKQNTEWHLKWL